jgi:hypothetical protein
VSERVFVNLPDNEKKLWHSHNYEVKSGELVAPRIPNTAEHSFMEALVTTYGKPGIAGKLIGIVIFLWAFHN